MRVKLWLSEVREASIPEHVSLFWRSPDGRFELVTSELSRRDDLVKGLELSSQEAIYVDISREEPA